MGQVLSAILEYSVLMYSLCLTGDFVTQSASLEFIELSLLAGVLALLDFRDFFVAFF